MTKEVIFSKSEVIWLVKYLVRKRIHPKGEKGNKKYVYIHMLMEIL